MSRPGFPYPEDYTATAHDEARAAAVLAGLRQATGEANMADEDRAAAVPWDDPAVTDLLSAIFGNSPIFGRVARLDSNFLLRLLLDDPAPNHSEILAESGRAHV